MKNGNLQDYLASYTTSSNVLRGRFARQAVEAVKFIHDKEIVHSDLAVRQFLVDDYLDIRFK